MGFYSIYKIIKDMFRTLFGNKALKTIILALFIILFFFVSSNVFAVNISDINSMVFTDNILNNNITVNLPSVASDYPYCALFIRNDSPSNTHILMLYLAYEPIVVSFNDTRTFISFDLDNTGGPNGYRYQCKHSTSNGLYNNYYFNFNQETNSGSSVTTSHSGGSGFTYTIETNPDISKYLIYANHTIRDTDNNIIYNSFQSPNLSNTVTELENLSFNNFIINANSFTQEMIDNPDEPLVMLFYNRSLSNTNNTDGLYPIKEKLFYKESIYFDQQNSTNDNYIFNFPIFKTGVFFNIGSTYEIRFAKRVYNDDTTWQYEYFDDRYIFTISSNVTQDYINSLNQQTATSADEDNQEDIENAINNQTQSIDNINNTINDSNIDNSSINLPTDNTQDITQNGVDNIFQTIYNSFTSGTAQDIVFPIPFTNKSITLSANYLSNMLQNNNASWLIMIIQAFWWYIISRFIITDVMGKIKLIKQGNFENIQNDNIKGDML